MSEAATSSGKTGDGGVWSVLLRLAVVFVVAVGNWLLVIAVADVFFGSAFEDRIGHFARAVVTTALVVPVVYLACRYLDRRPFSDLRLTSLRTGWRPFVFGAIFWLVMAGIGVTITLLAGWAGLEFGVPGADMALLAVYLPLLVFLYEALPEELIFRGYFYRNLSELLPIWVAVVGQAALFTLWGVAFGAAGSVDRVILFFTFSVVLGILRVVTGNLWACIGFHVAFQYVTQFLGAAEWDGFVEVTGLLDLQVVAFWFFPTMLGAIILLLGRRLIRR